RVDRRGGERCRIIFPPPSPLIPRETRSMFLPQPFRSAFAMAALAVGAIALAVFGTDPALANAPEVSTASGDSAAVASGDSAAAAPGDSAAVASGDSATASRDSVSAALDAP